MPEKPYLWEFRLVDPNRLASTGSVEESTVLVITGLVNGKWAEWGRLTTARAASQLTNRNIVKLTHRKTHAAQFQRDAAKDGDGGATYTYCARCGRRFQTNDECKRCGITFHVTSETEYLVTNKMPIIPAKVVAYETQRAKHKFVIPPPRA
jgi:hypothetical protein